jgi:large subunit ribosomal protein L6
MSKVGKQILVIPPKTEVMVTAGEVTVKGPLGELKKRVPSQIAIAVENNQVTVTPNISSKLAKSLWGTYASHIKNMISGVHTPFKKVLYLEGIGYKSDLSGGSINFSVGFSHPVKIPVPTGITATVEKNVITVSGPDKELVGQFAANVRRVKPPEPYKGKGLRYDTEVVVRKQGKKATA